MNGTKTARLALALIATIVPGVTEADPCTSGEAVLGTRFNGTPVPAGTYLWFNSVLKPSFPKGTSGPVTFFLSNATLTLTPKNGSPVSYPLPNAQVTYSQSFTTAATTYDGAFNSFFTQVPAGFGDKVFLTGLSLPLPDGLPPGVDALFSGNFNSDTSGVSLQFKFAAAVYKQFDTDYNVLGIKPTHGGPDPYPGGHQAGTPENFVVLEKNVIGGGTGGGSSNFTGSYSATISVDPCALDVLPS